MSLILDLRQKTTTKLHENLVAKSASYCAWHQNSYHKYVHFAVFAISLVVFGSASYSSYETVRASAKIIGFDNKNAHGQSVGGAAEFLDQDTGENLGQGRNGNKVVASLTDKKVKLKYVPDNGLVTLIEFDDVVIPLHGGGSVLAAAVGNSNGNANANSNGNAPETPPAAESDADIEIALDEPETPPGWDKVLAVGDVKGFTFSKGRFKRIAEGKDVFKCLNWDYESRKCNGRWQKIADVVPGQEYTIEFAPGDPGYAEKSNRVNVLNRNKELLNYTESVVQSTIDAAKESVNIILQEALEAVPLIPITVKNLIVHAIDQISELNEIIINTIVDDPIAPEAFVIDTTNIVSEQVQIEQQATGNLLLNCVTFDESVPACSRWKKERNIVRDENYVIALSSPGKSVFGQSRDGVVVLDKNLEVLASNGEVENLETKRQISVQMIDLNPNKITTYFDNSSTADSGEIILNTEATAVATESGKIITLDLSQAEAIEADVEGIAEGWDLFKCSDFDFENQACRGKYKKEKDLISGESYTFNIKNEENLQGFLESKKKIAVLNAEEELLTYTETETTVDGASIVEIVPEAGHPIRKIKVRNSNSSLGNDLKISPTVIADQAFLQGYAIDPSAVSADSMELELEAKGNTLYKCKEWDFAGNACLGVWVKYKNINPGETYTVPIDSQDPGFMETNESPTETPAEEAAPAPQLSQSSQEIPPPEDSVPVNPPAVSQTTSGSTSGSIYGGSIKRSTGSRTTTTTIVTAPTVTTAPVVATVVTAPLIEIKPSIVENAFDLEFGMEGSEIRNLQEILSKYPDIYPEGLITGYFGDLTRAAVLRFQQKYGIDPVGRVGPKTREILSALGSTAGKKIFTKPLYFGLNDDEVKNLQEFLARDRAIYPEGLITGYFGEATLAAVKKLQCRENIICSGAAWGYVGPATRGFLNK